MTELPSSTQSGSLWQASKDIWSLISGYHMCEREDRIVCQALPALVCDTLEMFKMTLKLKELDTFQKQSLVIHRGRFHLRWMTWGGRKEQVKLILLKQLVIENSVLLNAVFFIENKALMQKFYGVSLLHDA